MVLRGHCRGFNRNNKASIWKIQSSDTRDAVAGGSRDFKRKGYLQRRLYRGSKIGKTRPSVRGRDYGLVLWNDDAIYGFENIGVLDSLTPFDRLIRPRYVRTIRRFDGSGEPFSAPIPFGPTSLLPTPDGSDGGCLRSYSFSLQSGNTLSLLRFRSLYSDL